MGTAVTAVVGVQVVVFIQERTRTGRYGTFSGMMKADQFPLHNASVHHSVEMVCLHEIAV